MNIPFNYLDNDIPLHKAFSYAINRFTKYGAFFTIEVVEDKVQSCVNLKVVISNRGLCNNHIGLKYGEALVQLEKIHRQHDIVDKIDIDFYLRENQFSNVDHELTQALLKLFECLNVHAYTTFNTKFDCSENVQKDPNYIVGEFERNLKTPFILSILNKEYVESLSDKSKVVNPGNIKEIKVKEIKTGNTDKVSEPLNIKGVSAPLHEEDFNGDELTKLGIELKNPVLKRHNNTDVPTVKESEVTKHECGCETHNDTRGFEVPLLVTACRRFGRSVPTSVGMVSQMHSGIPHVVAVDEFPYIAASIERVNNVIESLRGGGRCTPNHPWGEKGRIPEQPWSNRRERDARQEHNREVMGVMQKSHIIFTLSNIAMREDIPDEVKNALIGVCEKLENMC